MTQPFSVPPPVTLAAPVGTFMRPTLTCASEDTIERAVSELRRNGCGVLPIVTDGQLIGVLSEPGLATALANATSLWEACGAAVSTAATIPPYRSGAEAFRMLSEMESPILVVVDDAQRVMGVLTPSDLFPRRRMLPRPPMVGGMATPLGVYLTSGWQKGGVSLLAVMATGAVMFSMLVVSAVIVSPTLAPLDKSHLPEFIKIAAPQSATILLFLLMMRLIPLSGTHGAEHMVVHAMERGEELTPEIVSRMPRVHPRCGTNLAVGAFLFMGILSTPWIADEDIRFLTAGLTTLFLWRPLGSFAQQYITTKKPNAKQLRNGIKAGTELMERYSTAHSSVPSIPARLWNSGLLQVIAGSTSTYLLLKGAMWAFHFTIPGLD